MAGSIYSIRRFLAFALLAVFLLVPFFLPAETVQADSEKDSFRRAVAALKDGNYDLALTLFESTLTIRIADYGENSSPVANVLSNIGVIKSQLGLYSQAINYYERAEKIYLQLGEERLNNIAGIRQNLGICYGETGDIEKALNYYESADRVYRDLQSTSGKEYENLLINLTVFYYEASRFSDAFEFCNKAFKISTNDKLEYRKWASRGMIYLRLKDYNQSFNCFKEALKIGEFNHGGNFLGKETIYLNLGLVSLNLSDFENSLKYYDEARLFIEKNIGKQNPVYAHCLNETGQVYLKKSEQASNLGNFLAEKRKNTLVALDYFQQALMAIAPGFSSKDFTQNPPTAANVLDKTKLLDALKSKAEALRMMSDLEEKGGDREKSIRYFENSLASFEEASKVIHLIRTGFMNQESRLKLAENEHPVYLGAVDAASRLYQLTGKKQYFEKAFEFSERSRSTDFQTMIRDLHAKQFGGLPDSLLQKEKELKSEIAAYESFVFNENAGGSPDPAKLGLWKDKIFALNKEYDQLIDLFENKYPRYYDFKYADPIVSLDEVQDRLESREAIIEYVVKDPENGNPGEVIAFIIKNNHYQLYRHPLEPMFDETVSNFLGFLKSGAVSETRKRDYQKYVDNAFSLNKWLLAPFSAGLQDYRLIVVPDDKLAYLPFDAFITSMPDTTKMDFRNLKYLVYDHAVSYTYSATLLYYYFKKNREASKDLAAFAPEYNGADFDVNKVRDLTPRDRLFPLPGARKEVAGITGLISGDVFMGAEASEEKFKQVSNQYDILHLAMHTVINDSLPMYSKLVFTPETKTNSDGWLDTYEIYNLELKSRMAVLSACNTGSGRLQRGEGVMSLARAFLYSGCPSIIMTLWSVEDISSAELMINFYQNLKNGMSKDEALRKAKIGHIQSADPLKAHPYYWLGYVSVGSQSPLYRTKVPYFAGMIIFVLLAIVFEKLFIRRKGKKEL